MLRNRQEGARAGRGWRPCMEEPAGGNMRRLRAQAGLEAHAPGGSRAGGDQGRPALPVAWACDTRGQTTCWPEHQQ